jgi:hypothetical protein
MRTVRFVKCILVLAAFVLTSSVILGSDDVRLLSNKEIKGITGGGNCMCKKMTPCGSATCDQVGDHWENCKGGDSGNFCTATSSNKNCSSDGYAVPCDKKQTCNTSQCNTCSPGWDDCTKTSSSTGDPC